MARKSSFDPDAAQKIIASYERAKKHDPTLTPAEFMWSVPAVRYKENAKGERVERFKSKTSAGAYFRVLKQGRRTGGVIYEEAVSNKEKGLYQVSWKVEGEDRYVSRNLSVANASSEFDIAAIEAELKTPKKQERLQKIVDQWQKKYGFETTRISTGNLRVRQTVQQRRPALRMSI